jgi:hypothetical protein
VYERHATAGKHKNNVDFITKQLTAGLIKTRRGIGSKKILDQALSTADVADLYNTEIMSPPREKGLASEMTEDIDIGMSVPISYSPESTSIRKKDEVVTLNSMKETKSTGVSMEQLEGIFGKNNKNSVFFHQESKNQGSGGEYLLKKAFNLEEDKIITSDEQRFVFELTTLLLSMTTDDRSRLGYIIGSVVDMKTRRTEFSKI